MALRFPDDEKKEQEKTFFEKEWVENPVNKTEVQQPELLNIDCTKARNIQEIGILFNALGIAITEDFAKLHQLEHMIAWKEEDTKS